MESIAFTQWLVSSVFWHLVQTHNAQNVYTGSKSIYINNNLSLIKISPNKTRTKMSILIKNQHVELD